MARACPQQRTTASRVFPRDGGALQKALTSPAARPDAQDRGRLMTGRKTSRRGLNNNLQGTLDDGSCPLCLRGADIRSSSRPTRLRPAHRARGQSPVALRTGIFSAKGKGTKGARARM